MADQEAKALTSGHGHKVKNIVLGRDKMRNKCTVLYGPSGSGKSVWLCDIMLGTLRGHVINAMVVSENEKQNHGFARIVPPCCVHQNMYMCAPDCKSCASEKLWRASLDEYLNTPPEERAKKTRPTRVVCEHEPTSQKDAKAGAERFLKEIFKRQTALLSVWEQANDHAMLYGLVKRWHANCGPTGRAQQAYDRVLEALAEVQQRREHAESEIKAAKLTAALEEDKLTELRTNSFELAANYCKRLLRLPGVADALRAAGVSKREDFALSNLDIDPHLLLVFDDCATQLKPLENSQAFKKLFYQGRHYKITTLITAQSVTDIGNGLRMNAHNTVITESSVADHFFQLLKMPKAEKLKAEDILKTVFDSSEDPHRKLFFIRDDATKQKFYYATARVRARRWFVGPAVLALQRLIDAKRKLVTATYGEDGEEENPYMRMLRG